MTPRLRRTPHRSSCRSRQRPLICALVSALGAFAAGCGAAEPRRLGVSVSPEGVEAARLAAAEINAGGGIHGRRLELSIAASGGAVQAQHAIAAADSFVRDASILAVVGHGNSASSLAASQIYNAARLPHIAPTTTAPLFSRAGPFSFRLVPDDLGQAQFLARQALAAGRSKTAILYVNDDYGRGLYAALREELQRLGVSPIFEAPYLEGGQAGQLEGALGALAKGSPELLFWLGRSPELTPILESLRTALPGIVIIGSDGLESPEMYADPRYVGVRVVRFVDLETGGIGLQRFRAEFQRAAQRPVTGGAVLAYDAVMLLVEALRSGAGSREEVREYLAAVGRRRPPFHGLSGQIAFDEHGDVTRSYHLATVGNGGAEAPGAR